MNMKKHIALGIAAAVLGVSGVAGALVSVDQLTAASKSESSISATTDKLAANCWMITGSASDAGCKTSVAGVEVPGLPELPGVPGVDLDDLTGLLAMADGAVDAATGAAATAQGIVGAAVPTAQGIAAGAVPTACNVPSLPVGLPVPNSIFKAGLSLFSKAQDLAMNDLGAASLASPVDLPVSVPTADDLINKIETETGCLATHADGLPVAVPSVCSVSGGLPSAVTSAVPTEISGLLASVASELAGISGQGVNVAGNGSVGVNCNIDGAVNSLPVPASVTNTVGTLAGLAKVPPVGSVTGTAGTVTGTAGTLAGTATSIAGTATGTVSGAPDMVTGLVGQVTGTVDSILGGDLPVSVPPLPLPTSTPNCSASASGSANVLGGLLGSLTSTITGGCK
jgi:hypothetical protein